MKFYHQAFALILVLYYLSISPLAAYSNETEESHNSTNQSTTITLSTTTLHSATIDPSFNEPSTNKTTPIIILSGTYEPSSTNAPSSNNELSSTNEPSSTQTSGIVTTDDYFDNSLFTSTSQYNTFTSTSQYNKKRGFIETCLYIMFFVTIGLFFGLFSLNGYKLYKSLLINRDLKRGGEVKVSNVSKIEKITMQNTGEELFRTGRKGENGTEEFYVTQKSKQGYKAVSQNNPIEKV